MAGAVSKTPNVSPGEVKSLTADMAAVISADATLYDVQEKLAEVGQWLPMDGLNEAGIGELVEFNSSGPMRLGFGAWRDLILGVQFTNGNGELITAGGQTLKNVAGYDLSKFMIGQGGVFGRVVTITTRTYRKPTAALLARFDADVKVMPRAMSSACRPQWAVMSPDWLYLGYLGDEQTIDYYARHVGQLGALEAVKRDVAQDVQHRQTLWKSLPRQHSGRPIFYRASVPPMRIKDFSKEARSSWWVADAAFGFVLGACEGKGEIPSIKKAASQAGGSVYFRSIENGALLETELDAVQEDLLKRLKMSFDPQGTLAALPLSG